MKVEPGLLGAGVEELTASGRGRVAGRSIMAIAVGVSGFAFLVTTDFWSLETSYILDDYALCATEGGVTGLWEGWWSLTGWYRPMTYPVTALRFLTCDSFWVHKSLGLVLHTVVGGFVWQIGRKAGLGIPAAFASSAIFLFNPFALEAIAWPAVVYGYPLAALLLVSYGLGHLSGFRPVTLGLLGLLAVMTNEQTLPIVVVLPLLLFAGSWRQRVRRFALVAGPAIAVFLLTALAGQGVGYQRAAAVGPNGVATLLENLQEQPENLTLFLPTSDPWMAFSDGGATSIGILGWLAVVIATTAAVWGHLIDLPSAPVVRLPAKSALALLGAVLLMLPLYAQSLLLFSPRNFYLPYLGVALAFGFVAEWLSRRLPPLVFLILLAPLGVFWFVGDGLRADSGGYRVTSREEEATAGAIAATMGEAPHAAQLILVDSPWTFVPERPLMGHHIVQAFSVPWAVTGALQVLAEYELVVPVHVDYGGTEICLREGVLTVRDVGQIEDLGDTVVFSVAARDRVGRLIVDDEEVVIADAGTSYAVLPCLLS